MQGGFAVVKGLTSKQQVVCDLLARGLSNKQIARQIGITFRTVEYHRQEIYKKMDVRNVVELVRKLLGAQ